MKKTIPNPISQNIKKYRLLNKMTQEELAGLLDLDTQYYAQLERGERNFTIEKIIRFCSIFHIGIDQIIEVAPTENENVHELTDKITTRLQELSYSQLTILDRFLSEIIPYVK